MLTIFAFAFNRDQNFYTDTVFGVDLRMVFLLCQVILESLVRFGLSAWFGSLFIQLKTKLNRLNVVDREE